MLWEASDRVCGKRLKALLPTLVPALERHGHVALDPRVREQVMAVSAATIDRRLASARAVTAGQRRRRRSGGDRVRSRVPVRTFGDWQDPAPGFVEADLVAHCGSRSGRSGPRSCGPASVSTRCATALWVTRRPSRGSDGSYGPCGPAWTGRPGRPRRPRDAADRRIPDGAPDGNRLESASNGGDKPAGLAPRGAHGVACAGLREGDGGPPGAGGGRAARPRPTPTPTFWPGARRVPRRAPGQSEPPGGLVRPLNTWPHDRHDSRRRSSLRSAVVTRDSPLRWPAVPGLASLPPLPITRLPLRVRQHHKTIATPLRNGPGHTPNTGPPARRPGRWRAGERVQLVVHREVTDRRERRIQRRIHG